MDSFLDTIRNLGPARLAMMLAVLVGLLVFFAFVSMRATSPSMALLYSELSTLDSSEIAAKLETVNIPYQISADGSQVSVPRDQVGRARMLLAEAGLPNGGSMGYEIFDKSQGFGTTDFVQNINQLRALEGELARTISTLEPVRSARVHLVLPQRELFSREDRPASASVFIHLKGANTLSREQVLAIQHIVASAVPQLKPKSVSVVDAAGNLLARGAGEAEDSAFAGASSTDEYRRNYEQRLTVAVEDLVSRTVGQGKVRAHVTVDMDFDRISTNAEIYDPEGQVVRSTQTVEEKENDSSGGQGAAVTVENNLPGLPGGASSSGGASGSQNSRTEETVNYEITRKVENIVRESGQVQKISVAVLVDGKYDIEEVTAEDGAKTEKRTYVPRSQEELDRIAALVKSAIGYDSSRGDTLEVVNMQFADVPFADIPLDENLIMGFERGDILKLAETVTMGILGVLVLLLVVKPLVSHMAAPRPASPEGVSLGVAGAASLLPGQVGHAPALAAPTGMLESQGAGGDDDSSMIDMQQVEGRVKASTMQKISELVENHPNETISVIRSWMSQES